MKIDTQIKILIIENQWIEFRKLCDVLTGNNMSKYKFSVLLGIDAENNPVFYDNKNNKEKVEKDFISLVTQIRIWVNENNGYNEDYRKKAFKTILKLAQISDIIIMDHILGGSYSCLTGIDIANYLLEEDIKKTVLFLSKTEEHDKNILDRYEGNYMIDGIEQKGYKQKFMQKFQIQKNDINNYTKWIHKGYFGDEILKPEYIKKYVIKAIEDLLERKNSNIESPDYPK